MTNKKRAFPGKFSRKGPFSRPVFDIKTSTRKGFCTFLPDCAPVRKQKSRTFQVEKSGTGISARQIVAVIGKNGYCAPFSLDDDFTF